MATNYERGRNAEYRAKRKLEADGYTVFRTAGSKSPCDLIAFYERKPVPDGFIQGAFGPLDGSPPVFVQVKAGQRPMPKGERAAFADYARRHRARPLLVERGVFRWLDTEQEEAA